MASPTEDDLRVAVTPIHRTTPEQKAAKREWARINKAKIRAKHERYKAQPDFQQKALARGKLARAAQRGWIKRPSDLSQFHHPDYSRPYYGCWVTSLEHQHIHAGHLACPPCTDYSEQVEAQRKIALAERARKGGIAACKARWGNKETQ